MTKDPDDRKAILVVDDDEELARSLKSFLVERGFRAEIALDVSAARRLMADTTFDLFLLDLLMPGTSGKVLCREIAEVSRAGIVVISSLHDDEERISLLEMGADDYIVKPFNELELLARVRAFFRRVASTTVAPVTSFGPWTLGERERTVVHADGRVITLTASEAQVLRYFATNPGIVFDREDLLAVARVRQHGGGGDRSVDNLIKRLRRKLDEDPGNPRFIQTEWGKGYVFRS